MKNGIRMSDIAKELGVSVVTVSNALNDRGGVSEEMRKKIKERASELGYRPSAPRAPRKAAPEIQQQGGSIGILTSGALLLNPGDNDIRFNLKLANTKTVDKITPVSEIFFVTWFRSLSNVMSEHGWSVLGILTFLLALCMLALYIFARKISLKKLGFILAIISIIVCAFANIFASMQKAELLNRDHAIVMAASVTVRSTPNESGTELFILHEGTKIQIKDNTMKEWKEIRLEDGNEGWIQTSAIEVI